MTRPKNLVYGFSGVVERKVLNDLIEDMDVLSEMPPQGKWMDPEKMLRNIRFENIQASHAVYYVQDLQSGGPDGKSEKSGRYILKDGLITPFS